MGNALFFSKICVKASIQDFKKAKSQGWQQLQQSTGVLFAITHVLDLTIGCFLDFSFVITTAQIWQYVKRDGVFKGIFWYQEEFACLGWYTWFQRWTLFCYYPCLLLLFHNVLMNWLCLTFHCKLDAFVLIYKYGTRHVKLKMWSRSQSWHWWN